MTALLASGCMTSPLHNEWVDAHDEPIQFSGYTAGPGRDMTVECTPALNPFPGAPWSGEWHAVGSLTSTTQTLSQGGETWYYYSGSITLPDNCWLEQDNYTPRRQTWVRVLDDEFEFAHQGWTLAGYQCLVSEYFSGESPSDAADNCHDIGHPELNMVSVKAPLD